MAENLKKIALTACDDALRDSVSRISSVLLNGFIAAKSDKGRQSAADAARKGLQLSKEAHASMTRLVDEVFS